MAKILASCWGQNFILGISSFCSCLTSVIINVWLAMLLSPLLRLYVGASSFSSPLLRRWLLVVFSPELFFADVVWPVYLHSVLKAFAGGHLFVLCDESCGSVLRWAVRYTDEHSLAVLSMTGFHSAPPLLIFLFFLPFSVLTCRKTKTFMELSKFWWAL